MANAADYFSTGILAPQGQNENLLVYGPRALAELPARALFAVGGDLAKGAAALGQTYTQTPGDAATQALGVRFAQDRQQMKQPGGNFPRSFQDPMWDKLEQQYGGAEAPLLHAIRVNGERSNSDQVNGRTGATTPYQITASTRSLIQQKYKFDPWASPENAVKGAAIVLRDHGGASNPMAAIGGYFGGGAGAANPMSSATDGNLSVADYVHRVMGGLQNPFNPKYANMALKELNKAQAEAKQPYTYSFKGEPMPALPQPTPVPKTDFTQMDADLQAMKPVEMTLQEQKSVQWKDFWGGLGKAMMSSPEGEGLGSFFLRLGGGALAGKSAAADEIQQRKDAFDEKMSRWQAAVYAQDAQKASTAQNEALMDWKNTNDWANNNWKVAYDNWSRSTNITMSNGQLVQQVINPTTGQVTVHGVPIASAVDAEFARYKAGIYTQMFGEQNQANATVSSVENQVTGKLALAAAAQQLLGSGQQPVTAQDKAAAAAYGAGNLATFATENGLVPQVLGQDAANDIYKEVQSDLTARGMFPGTTGYGEAFNKGVATRVGQLALTSPPVMQALTQQAGPASQMFQSPDKRTVQTKTDASGRTTTTATDIFQ